MGCREDTDKGGDSGGDSSTSSVVDVDGDGYPEAVDCDDSDPDVHPGADEHCDGVDEDCDTLVDEEPVDGSTWYGDADGDGYGGSDFSIASCDPPEGYVEDDSDCDDLDPRVYPGAPETCDGLDNDCDGASDEDAIDEGTFYIDLALRSERGGQSLAPKVGDSGSQRRHVLRALQRPMLFGQ